MSAPAKRYENRHNSEVPKFYCVFLFRLASFKKENVELAIHALNNRWDKGAKGWRQDDIFMAYLDLADQAKKPPLYIVTEIIKMKCSFKLHALHKTVIEGSVKDGKLVE